MKILILFLLFGCLHAQTLYPFNIFDERVEDYENTTFKICFDSNGDLKSLNYVPYLSSLERPDLKSILEEFYMSPKFEAKKSHLNACYMSSSIQINPKYENAKANKKSCENMHEGQFVYGKTNLNGALIYITHNQFFEKSQYGNSTAQIVWDDACNYSLTNLVIGNEACENCRVKVEIVDANEHTFFQISSFSNLKQFQELQKVNSLSLQDSSQLYFAKNKNPQTSEVVDAFIEFNSKEIKFFNIVFSIGNATNIHGNTQSNAEFRMIKSFRENNSYWVEGNFSMNGVSFPIEFSMDINETKDEIRLRSEKIIFDPELWEFLPEDHYLAHGEMEFTLEFTQ
ncbi:MAG: hypothetical protein Q4G27_04925 [Flavobacteriaceae bacterium]|nr:hypothetical protein [Flavobacteriaceae bacterium]